ncbi:MAG: hypothetical protein KAI83_16515 [Thiomargarita sp.]|nr:hypothetical protein [Thiomargarita sp.]
MESNALAVFGVQRFGNWSPTLQLWELESNASALGIGVQRFSFGNWSPTLQL